MNRTQTAAAVRECLVGVVSNDADLDRFRTGGHYRIPEDSIGRAISEATLNQCRVLALYQTGEITSGLPGAIELYGRIRSVESCTRRQIVPDEPEHPSADRPYRLITVERVERLARPILIKQPRRIAFLRTTVEQLLSARDVEELLRR